MANKLPMGVSLLRNREIPLLISKIITIFAAKERIEL
jgi:hypothetical protein